MTARHSASPTRLARPEVGASDLPCPSQVTMKSQAESSSAEDAKALVKTVPRSSNLLFPTTSSWRLAQVLRRALRVQFGNEAASVGSHGWPSAKFNSVNKL
eukprot:CAMPEP_0206609238 /NCGR_PEP_ID=MMETSP0325_2-20121206/53625_1 /ASSEMBLY_ACC=CAM_ASM_000347 /TAXON_ID=2866 /ORGANISM="Crypthecodinium cohnii, Strain Seligo" /LENGTH=100 /DNA_ID=CAMNT_0054127401 /DNA_START=280 /DNA_END=582 /DNA_ORIENTATION=-